MCEWTPELDRAADQVADAIIDIAKRRHPGDADAIAACAITLTEGLVTTRIVSVESPSMTPAELELRLSSPGVKWNRQPRLA